MGEGSKGEGDTSPSHRRVFGAPWKGAKGEGGGGEREVGSGGQLW